MQIEIIVFEKIKNSRNVDEVFKGAVDLKKFGDVLEEIFLKTVK